MRGIQFGSKKLYFVQKILARFSSSKQIFYWSQGYIRILWVSLSTYVCVVQENKQLDLLSGNLMMLWDIFLVLTYCLFLISWDIFWQLLTILAPFETELATPRASVPARAALPAETAPLGNRTCFTFKILYFYWKSHHNRNITLMQKQMIFSKIYAFIISIFD